MCRKTKASILRLGAVRAHSVKIGPDMHCCRTARPMRDLHSLPFHYRSGAMRTELKDQQYRGGSRDVREHVSLTVFRQSLVCIDTR